MRRRLLKTEPRIKGHHFKLTQTVLIPIDIDTIAIINLHLILKIHSCFNLQEADVLPKVKFFQIKNGFIIDGDF